MTLGQQRFFAMLAQVPRIAHIWDKEKLTVDIDLLKAELGVMTPGEAHMAKFFLSIWFNGNNAIKRRFKNSQRYQFDLVDAVSYLDPPEIKLIMDWITDPFWP